jgi:hypothetical protein
MGDAFDVLRWPGISCKQRAIAAAAAAFGPKQLKHEGRQVCCMTPTRKKRTTRAIAPGFASSIPAPTAMVGSLAALLLFQLLAVAPLLLIARLSLHQRLEHLEGTNRQSSETIEK